MKVKFVHLLFIILLLINHNAWSQSNVDSIKYCLSANYYKDFSDTYGGGNLFSVELGASRSWYGVKINYGLFESKSTFILTIPLEESNKVLEIPFDEMAIMKLGTLSLVILPIQKKRFSTELIFGFAFAKAQNLCAKGVEYEYDLLENKFIYLAKDYQLVNKNHFGYQAGLNINLFFLKRLGMQLNVRLQDLNNGGTFFLLGGGFNFIL